MGWQWSQQYGGVWCVGGGGGNKRGGRDRQGRRAKKTRNGAGVDSPESGRWGAPGGQSKDADRESLSPTWKDIEGLKSSVKEAMTRAEAALKAALASTEGSAAVAPANTSAPAGQAATPATCAENTNLTAVEVTAKKQELRNLRTLGQATNTEVGKEYIGRRISTLRASLLEAKPALDRLADAEKPANAARSRLERNRTHVAKS